MASSSLPVTPGSAGAPSEVENLILLYSGGLYEAVKLIPPAALSFPIANEIAGVGVGPWQKSTRKPFCAASSVATAENLSPMNRESCPNINGPPTPSVFK